MGVVKTVNLKDFAKEIGAFTEREIENLRVATQRGIINSIPKLVEDSPVDTGLYASSWDFTETEFGMILGNYAPHAAIIEHGARPFTPPLDPLIAWAARVLQVPADSADARRLAYLTQQKIKREGMAPRNILANAMPGIMEEIRKEYEAMR